MANKAVWLAFVALIFYAFPNVLFEKKFANYNLFAVQTYIYAVMLPLSIAGWLFSKELGQDLPTPKGSIAGLMILAGALFVIADTCFMGAYNKNYGGGTVFTVTTIVVMFPALTGLIKNLWDGGKPNGWQVTSYLLAILAVLAAARGSLVKTN